MDNSIKTFKILFSSVWFIWTIKQILDKKTYCDGTVFYLHQEKVNASTQTVCHREISELWQSYFCEHGALWWLEYDLIWNHQNESHQWGVILLEESSLRGINL